MKGLRNLMGLAVILCPLNAWALDFDWSPDTTRYLSDPAFLPLKGQLESTTTLDFATYNGDRSGTVTTDHQFIKSDGVSETVAYGITDRLTIGGSASWSKQDDKYSVHSDIFDITLQSHSSSHGYTNPTFSVTYRIIDQIEFPVSIDGSASFVPELAQSTGVQLGGEVRINRTMKSATVQGVAGATYLGPGDSGTLHFESASDYYFGINGQVRLPKGFAINAGLLYDQESDRIFNNTYTEQYDPNISTYIGVEYSIIPNRIVAGIKYAHIFVGDTTQSFAGPPNLNVININASTITEVWTSQKTDIYSAHVRWLF